MDLVHRYHTPPLFKSQTLVQEMFHSPEQVINTLHCTMTTRFRCCSSRCKWNFFFFDIHCSVAQTSDLCRGFLFGGNEFSVFYGTLGAVSICLPFKLFGSVYDKFHLFISYIIYFSKYGRAGVSHILVFWLFFCVNVYSVHLPTIGLLYIW